MQTKDGRCIPHGRIEIGRVDLYVTDRIHEVAGKYRISFSSLNGSERSFARLLRRGNIVTWRWAAKKRLHLVCPAAGEGRRDYSIGVREPGLRRP